MLFKPEKDTRLTFGATAIYLKAGVVRELHGEAAKQAQIEDVPTTDEVETDDEAEVGEVRTDVIQAIVVAMEGILAEGDESLLTRDKTPRFDEVKKRAGVKVTREDYDLAWDLVED